MSPMLWFIGFAVIFTIGGMAGVMLAVPPIDFQLHNSLFLVAHFHMMIVGGVLFGFFAGITYWFPKYLGFKLNEKLGRLAFWCWLIGFILAFVPLYILGFMGATRRLNHYSASLGWQPLFIVAGIGAGIIALGVAVQLLQVVVSIIQRRDNRDLTGDPWDGRSLEWSTPSPVPFYNFARLPHVSERDAFWVMKKSKLKDRRPYEDITLPKNSPLAMVIAGGGLAFSFAIVWHIWWLAIIGLLVSIVTIIVRSLDEDTEYTIPAKEVEILDKQLSGGRI